MFPIDILQPKLLDFSGAESINGEEHQNGASADITGSIGIHTSYQAFDVRPRRPHRQRFVRVNSWPLDRFSKTRTAPSLVACKAHERSQGLNVVADRTTATTAGGQMCDVVIEVSDFEVSQAASSGTAPDEEAPCTAIQVRDG
jgi:hypothetical protein